MAITFPTDPGAQSPVNTFSPSSTPVANSANGNTYVWNGTAWTTQQANLEQYVNVAGDVMTGPLTGTSATYSGNIAAANLPTNGSIVGYQQGTWTPDCSVSGSVAAVAKGYWTRVGNQVTVVWRLQFSTLGGNGSSLGVSGFPYSNGLDIHVPGVIRESTNTGAIYTCQINAAQDEGVMNSYEGGTLGSVRTLRTDEQYDGCIAYITNDTTWTPLNGATVS
ncbi:hypothetical protein [Synechococcus phage S-H34]|uniref:Uncharacterized protein n=1 Tax=Synechococcus phage S-H34 TaxID=2718942 RepID=A0A6G8R694_9CAUD|nr:hypothetical protein PQC15_gp059 [Synechococcus phage S-H34]QIN96931.1 hypothetical protein [Synechococcus phage S-H34]